MTFLLNLYTFQKNDYSRIRQTFQRKQNRTEHIFNFWTYTKYIVTIQYIYMCHVWYMLHSVIRMLVLEINTTGGDWDSNKLRKNPPTKDYSFRTEHRRIDVAFYASLLKCLLSDQKIDKSLYAMRYFLF